MRRRPRACAGAWDVARIRALLDTDLIIWFLRGREHARRWIHELSKAGVPSCSALSVTEVTAGMRPSEEADTKAFLRALDVIPVDREIAWRAGALIGEYGRRGITLDFVDATIAATCLRRKVSLATYNVKHYPMPSLRKVGVPSSEG